MPAPAAYARRQFPGAAADTTISSGINNSDTSCSLASTSGWPTGSYTGGILCELYSTTTGNTAEKVWATALSGSSLTIVRAADGSSATSHAAGTGIRPVAGAIDADEANRAVNETIGQVTTAGDMLVADGAASMTRLAVGTAGQVPVSSGTAPVWKSISGDATLAASGALTIANDAVTAAKIAADAVGSSEIAADAVGSSEIAAGAVTASELASDAVVTAKILDSNVTTAKLADDGVTLAKLAASAKSRWMVGPFFFDLTGLTTGAFSLPIFASDPSGIEQVPIPEACAVTGLSIATRLARTSGDATFDVTVNGSAIGMTAAIDGSNTQYAYGTQSETSDAVSAGQRIGVSCTTNNVLSPAGSNHVAAYVLLQAV